ncbi:MAG: hypothetical protein ACXVXW_04885 [Mycobacteriaceae bacterium]
MTEMTVITATNGKQATAPAAFAAKWDQKVVDSLVMQAHRGGVADRATCRVVGVEAVV